MPANGCDGPHISVFIFTNLLEIGIMTLLRKKDNEQHVKMKTETITHCEKRQIERYRHERGRCPVKQKERKYSPNGKKIILKVGD
jgi:hypothetical protein